MNQNSEKKRKGVWQDVVAVDVYNKALTLQAKSNKVYTFRPKEWHARFSIEDLAKFVERGDRVRVIVDFQTETVRGAFHEEKVMGKEKKVTTQVRNKKKEEPPKILFELGNKPILDLEDKAWIELEKGERGWVYRMRLWEIKPLSEEDPHKVVRRTIYEPVAITLVSDNPFNTKEDALKEAIHRASKHIVGKVLGRTSVGEYPAEDELSFEGRKWLRRLDAIARKYLNEKVRTDMPAGLRFIKSVPLESGVLLLTEDEHIGFLTGAKPEDVDFLKDKITGRKVTFDIYFDENKPFVKINKGVYNIYSIAAMLEGFVGKKILTKDGRFVENLKGKGIALVAEETEKKYLIIPVSGRGHYILGASGGVDMKYIQVPEFKEIEETGKEEETSKENEGDKDMEV